MKNLETCDWMLLNSIIYKIYTMEDLDEMRREFLEQLHLVIDFDSADFYLAAVVHFFHNDRPAFSLDLDQYFIGIRKKAAK